MGDELANRYQSENLVWRPNISQGTNLSKKISTFAEDLENQDHRINFAYSIGNTLESMLSSLCDKLRKSNMKRAEDPKSLHNDLAIFNR